MKRQLFVNLPVKDPAASQRFFRALGFEFNPQYFGTFTPNPVCDARKNTEVLICLLCESRAEVDALIKKVVNAGGRAVDDPKEYSESMYARSFQDLDGHMWELMHMAGEPAPAA